MLGDSNKACCLVEVFGELLLTVFRDVAKKARETIRAGRECVNNILRSYVDVDGGYFHRELDEGIHQAVLELEVQYQVREVVQPDQALEADDFIVPPNYLLVFPENHTPRDTQDFAIEVLAG